MFQKNLIRKAFSSCLARIVCLALILVLLFFNSRAGKSLYKVVKLFSAFDVSTLSLNSPSDVKPVIVSYPDDSTETNAIVFKSKNNKQPIVIISDGVGITPESIKLMNDFAANLSKIGIGVIIPRPKDLDENLVTPKAINSFVNAYLYFEQQPWVEKDKIGFFGFCAGGSFVLLASSDPLINSKVNFSLVFAPYNNMLDYYAQAFSKKAITSYGVRDWQPIVNTTNILVKNLSYRLTSNSYSSELNNNRLIEEFLSQDDPYKLINILKEKLPPNIIAEANSLSPNLVADKIESKVYIIHDIADVFTPVEESERLADALGSKAQLYESTIFQHTFLNKNKPITTFVSEMIKLAIIFYKVIYRLS